MSASLGGLLKDYRLQRNIPQLEIAFSLGWKDTSRLSRIEQGIVEKPPRELIDKICKAMGLKEQEKNQLLLIGNYLPTKEEIQYVRKENEAYLEKWPYPAVLYDFCWRFIIVNKKALKLFGMTENDRKKLYEATPCALEIVFDPNFVQNKYLTGKEELQIWHKNLFRFLAHFRNLQRSILTDKWYVSMMKRLMNSDSFLEVWQKMQRSELDFTTTRYGEKLFVHPDDKKKRLHFNIFVVPLLKDPRFELEFFNPGDIPTAKYFKQTEA